MSTQNLEQFFSNLSLTPRDWYVDRAGMIRRHGADGEECPLSSLMQKESSAANDVGRELGMTVEERMAIIYAADQTIREPGDDATPADWEHDVSELIAIRAALYLACGLDHEHPYGAGSASQS